MSIFDRRATTEAMKVAEAGQSRHRRRSSMATVAGISTVCCGGCGASAAEGCTALLYTQVLLFIAAVLL